PGEMRVDEAPQFTAPPGTAQVGRMNIAFPIAEFMVAPMHRHPRQHAAQAGHRAADEQERRELGTRLERARRKKPVIADRDAEAGPRPDQEKQADLDPPDWMEKQQRDGGDSAEKGEHVEQQEVFALDAVQVWVVDDFLAPRLVRVLE